MGGTFGIRGFFSGIKCYSAMSQHEEDIDEFIGPFPRPLTALEFNLEFFSEEFNLSKTEIKKFYKLGNLKINHEPLPVDRYIGGPTDWKRLGDWVGYIMSIGKNNKVALVLQKGGVFVSLADCLDHKELVTLKPIDEKI